MGLALYGVTLVTWRWEHNWAPSGAGIPRYLRHNICKHAMRPETMCSSCGKLVEVRDTGYEVVPGRALPCGYTTLSAPVVGEREVIAARSAFVHITDILGDRWTPLVLCAAFLGLRRFDEIQSGLEIATNILTHRLNYLVDHRILERRQYSERPPRYEYRLTQKGRDLFPHALMRAVGRSLARAARRPESARVPQDLRRAAQRRRRVQSLPQDDRSTRCHLPAGSGRDRCPARRCPPRSRRSLAHSRRARRRSLPSIPSLIIWARS